MKGESDDIGMLQFRSFSWEKEQLVEKEICSGEIGIDATNSFAPDDQMEVIVNIVSIVAKASADKSIHRMETLSKQT